MVKNISITSLDTPLGTWESMFHPYAALWSSPCNWNPLDSGSCFVFFFPCRRFLCDLCDLCRCFWRLVFPFVLIFSLQSNKKYVFIIRRTFYILKTVIRTGAIPYDKSDNDLKWNKGPCRVDPSCSTLSSRLTVQYP